MSAALWTLSDIARVTGGSLHGDDQELNGVSIDTRSLEVGDLFVALSGERDGHDFVDQALARGAGASLVTRSVAGPHVIVGDVMQALEALGQGARDRAPHAIRAGVTGSVGKTSVTRAIEACLRGAGPAHASVKSYNNHIGVPLTLARMPRETQRAVFEVGMNHPDEIVPLSRMIRPHVVAITTVGPVHLENFDEGEAGVAAAKAEIFEGLEPDGAAVLNGDNRWFEFLRQQSQIRQARVLKFGTDTDCDARLVGLTPLPEGGQRIDLTLFGQARHLEIRQNGTHWGLNTLCVLLALSQMDVEFETAADALQKFEPIDGRGAIVRIAIGAGSATLIDESYNANPVSMRAAIATLGSRPGQGRRIAVLTDMLELGPDSEQFHRDLAEPVEDAGIDLVFCAGSMMKSLFEALPPTRRGGYALDAEGLLEAVVSVLQPEDQVMVKGSNGSRAGLIAAALRAHGQTAREVG
jgi:UDP-N-acetylmuramoyl-tripeptide--D-alanyl-D-alanine ligase